MISNRFLAIFLSLIIGSWSDVNIIMNSNKYEAFNRMLLIFRVQVKEFPAIGVPSEMDMKAKQGNK